MGRRRGGHGPERRPGQLLQYRTPCGDLRPGSGHPLDHADLQRDPQLFWLLPELRRPVYQRLQRSAEEVNRRADGGWDQIFGYGRINAGRAMLGTVRPATVGGFYGQVISSSGTPVSNATVSAGGIRAKTGDDGMFRLANLPEGTYTITVTPPSSGGSCSSPVPDAKARLRPRSCPAPTCCSNCKRPNDEHEASH